MHVQGIRRSWTSFGRPFAWPQSVDSPPSPTKWVGACQAILYDSQQSAGLDATAWLRCRHGYNVDMVVRKLRLPFFEGLPCQRVPANRIRSISADETKTLEVLRSKWTAVEASACICGRPDWPFSVVVCTCLWKESAGWGLALNTLCWQKCCIQPPSDSTPGGGELYDHVVSFGEEHGVSPHPSVLMHTTRDKTRKRRC